VVFGAVCLAIFVVVLTSVQVNQAEACEEQGGQWALLFRDYWAGWQCLEE
jgi:hypothetical protein